MEYSTYTHASLDIYPELLSKYRIVIYNGAVDACVPYNGNEDWTSAMAESLGMTPIKGEVWRPWVVGDVPAGYVTVYDNPTGPANFTFITVKVRPLAAITQVDCEPARLIVLACITMSTGGRAHGASIPAGASPGALQAVS